MATPESKLTGRNVKKAEEANSEKSAERTASEGGGYKIHIPMYEGPLDLLLDLIRQQKMNIHDIQISMITAQYLNYLHGGDADLHQEQDAAAAGSAGERGRAVGRSAGGAGATFGGTRKI